jgi:fructose-specific phosphotransferase system component IIB
MEVVRNAACSVGKAAQTIENEVQVETWGKNHIENKLTQGQIELLQKFGRRPFMNK